MSIDKTPVVKVHPWGKGQGDFVEINESDFDPQKHKLYNAKAPSVPPVAVQPPPPAPVVEDVKITADAKQLADETGVDLSKIVGTGHNGKITVKDVEKAIDEMTTPGAE